MNFWKVSSECVSVALDETTTAQDLWTIFKVLNTGAPVPFTEEDLDNAASPLSGAFRRESGFLQQDIFHACRSETELMQARPND